MRLLDTKTRYFDQDTFQIPQLTNTWGCMVDFLDTVLVLGSTSQNVLGIFSTEDILEPELYWLATIKLEVGHGFKSNLSVVSIQNSNIEAYNGLFRVQSVTADSITVAIRKSEVPTKPLELLFLDGVLINQPPLGYLKVFEAEYKAVYKLTTSDNKICYLRVDNTCPEGHNPSHAKFARVSMFSDMDSVDDYRYRLGRLKAPAYELDYDRTEENIYDVWFNTRYLNYRYFYLNNPPNLTTQKQNTVIGDSETFYFTIDSIREDVNANEDATYVFGRYSKYIYKEDPLPFILRTSTRESLISNYFHRYNTYDNFIRTSSESKHTFKTNEEDIYTLGTSDRWALWLDDDYLSGANTRINFRPYKNEINMNLFPMNLRFERKDNTVLEGLLRGSRSIMANLKDEVHLAPELYEVFRKDSNLYIRIPDRDGAHAGSFAILLNDWE